MTNPYHAYLNFRPFTETEAWNLFKIAAIAEAIGWTLLIVAILLRDHVLFSGIPVTIAGRIHGTFFAAYVFAVLALGPSLGWRWFRIVVAGLCSVPPYGSLVYEVISAHYRRKDRLRRLLITSYMA